jgi:hypothetical protein
MSMGVWQWLAFGALGVVSCCLGVVVAFIVMERWQ